MGAVAGVVGVTRTRPEDAVAAMLAAARHRGPGTRVVRAGPAVLGIAAGASSPDAHVTAAHGRAAAFAGALDNRVDLAKELGLDPAEAATPADVLVAGFGRWGESIVPRLRGAFSGVVFDGSRLWCFRDQVGFKPLFYRVEGDAFYVASEAKQVCAGAGLPRRADLDVVGQMYYAGAERDAAVAGVRRFMAGELAAVRPGGHPVGVRYWDPSPVLESRRIGVEDAVEQLAEMFRVAVERTITGRDAVTLSGGIDSSTIAAFAAPAHARIAGRPIVGVTVVYPHHPRVDESSDSGALAEHLGIPLRQIEFHRRVLADVEAHVDWADGPWDSLPMPHVLEVCDAAVQSGARSILVGDLAEYVYTLTYAMLGHMLLRGRIRALRSHTRALHSDGQSWARIARRVIKEVVPEPLGKAFYRLARRRSPRYPPWIDITVTGGSPYRNDMMGPVLKRWRELQIRATRGTSSTVEAHEICAAHAGIEVRRPLADVDLWEFFLSLRAEVKFPDPLDKSLVRRTMRGRVPDRILDNRVKTVFDDHITGAADFDGLSRWIDEGGFRVPGVDYRGLRERLSDRSITPVELVWAYDLARVHAFVARFG